MRLLEDQDSRKRELTRQIAELVKARSKIRIDNHITMENDRNKQDERDLGQGGNMKTSRKQYELRIISDEQLVPPGDKGFPPLPLTKRQKGMCEYERETRRKTAEWVTVKRKKGVKDRNPNEETKRVGTKGSSDQQPESRKLVGEGEKASRTPSRVQPKRRAPKTAAVTITGRNSTFSYAEALRKTREEISLKELGIDDSRIRKTANGGFLVEIPGSRGAFKAESLAFLRKLEN